MASIRAVWASMRASMRAVWASLRAAWASMRLPNQNSVPKRVAPGRAIAVHVWASIDIGTINWYDATGVSSAYPPAKNVAFSAASIRGVHNRPKKIVARALTPTTASPSGVRVAVTASSSLSCMYIATMTFR